jgi:hypothetical protein
MSEVTFEQPTYHHNTTHVSRSMLATFAESRRRYEAMYVTKTMSTDDESDALTIGTGTHAICLKDAFELDKILLIPDEVLASNGARTTNAYKQFAAENAGRTLMKKEQFRFCQALASKLTEAVGGFLNNPQAVCEKEFYWTMSDVDCRAKLDIVVPLKDEVLIIDLKTAADISPWGFWRAVRDRKLWLQDAHYSIPVEREYQGSVRFLFVVVEKSEPFRIRTYELSNSDRLRASEKHGVLVDQLSECHSTLNFAEEGEGYIIELNSLENAI